MKTLAKRLLSFWNVFNTPLCYKQLLPFEQIYMKIFNEIHSLSYFFSTIMTKNMLLSKHTVLLLLSLGFYLVNRNFSVKKKRFSSICFFPYYLHRKRHTRLKHDYKKLLSEWLAQKSSIEKNNNEIFIIPDEDVRVGSRRRIPKTASMEAIFGLSNFQFRWYGLITGAQG